jgi:hypothetical protein
VPVPGLGRFLLLFQIVVEGGIQGLQTTYHQFVTISMGEQFMEALHLECGIGIQINGIMLLGRSTW